MNGSSGTGFNTISPAVNNAIVISNGSANSATTDSAIYVNTTTHTIYADAFYQNSSRRLKTNIETFDQDALDILNQVNVVSFNYKSNLAHKHIGFIAEDTPIELSTIDQNTMDTNSAVGVLIKAVQELEARLKKLEGND